MAKAGVAKPAGGKGGKGRLTKSGGGFGWIQGLLCGAVLTLATPSAILLAVLLAPGWFGLMLDRGRGRLMGRAMLLFGSAATISPLLRLWREGHSYGPMMRLLGDLGVVGTGWLACLVGWLIAELVPVLWLVVLETRDRGRLVMLAKTRARIVEEWGETP